MNNAKVLVCNSSKPKKKTIAKDVTFDESTSITQHIHNTKKQPTYVQHIRPHDHHSSEEHFLHSLVQLLQTIVECQ